MPKYNVVLLGGFAAGKTSIARVASGDSFVESINTTIGSSGYNVKLNINSDSVFLNLMDTAGQEIFRAITPTSIKKADAAIFAFDSTKEFSFDDVKVFLEMFNENAVEGAGKYLVACKNDMPPYTDESIWEKYAQENDMEYFSTSAKYNIEIEHLMYAIANDIIENIKTGKLKKAEIKMKENEKKKGCC